MSKVVKIVGAAAVGFIAGILLAPKSGKETRADIKRKAVEAKDFAVEKAGTVKEKASAGFQAAREGAADASDEVSGFFGRTSKRTGVIARDAKKTASAVADDAKQTTRNVRDAVK